MTLKSHVKLEEKLTCGLENDMSNLANFHQNTLKCQNWYFHGILLSKVENAWATNLQRTYNQWHWRMMKNAKRNWLDVSKLTQGIWWILTQELKSLQHLHFNGLLLTKKLTCVSKNSHEEFGKFSPEHFKVSKLGLWWHAFVWSWKYVSFNEEWCKNWRGIDLSDQNWHEEFDEFWPEPVKI